MQFSADSHCLRFWPGLHLLGKRPPVDDRRRIRIPPNLKRRPPDRAIRQLPSGPSLSNALPARPASSVTCWPQTPEQQRRADGFLQDGRNLFLI